MPKSVYYYWREASSKADPYQDAREQIAQIFNAHQGRYGYRRVTALLRDAGWYVNRKRVERIWRREGLKVPQKQPKRGKLWLNDGSCIRLRPEYPGHVWSYNFVEGRTHDGRKFRILSIIDEASRECLALPVARGCEAKMYWRLSPSCSSPGGRRRIYGQTMARNLSPMPSSNG